MAKKTKDAAGAKAFDATVRLRLDKNKRERFKALAIEETEKHGLKFTMSDVMRRALDEWLAMRGQPERKTA